MIEISPNLYFNVVLYQFLYLFLVLSFGTLFIWIVLSFFWKGTFTEREEKRDLRMLIYSLKGHSG